MSTCWNTDNSCFLGCFWLSSCQAIGQDRNIQYIQPEGEDLESMKSLLSTVVQPPYWQMLVFVNTVHISSPPLFPSSLLMWWPLSSPLVSPSSLQSHTSIFFHPVSWSHKMSVTFPPPPFLLSAQHLISVSSHPCLCVPPSYHLWPVD